MKPPSLADFLHAWTYDERPTYPQLFTNGIKSKYLDRVEKEGKKDFREALLKADRFVLSDEFLRRCIMRANDSNISHILANADLARLPTNNVLVEWDDSVRAGMQEYLGTAPTEPNPDEDWARAGFLYTDTSNGWQAIHISSSPGSIPVWPATSLLRNPDSDDPIAEIKDHDLLEQFFASAWGITPPGQGGSLSFVMHDELLKRGFTSMDPYFAFAFSAIFQVMREKGTDAPMDFFMRRMLNYGRENCGSLRLAVAILASLNTVPTRLVHRVPKHMFTHRFRNMKELSTSSVFIDAKPGHEVSVYDKAFKQATGRHNRRHEVRGHWRDVSRETFHIVCEHSPADTDGDYALCGDCGRLLRWIAHHERGDEKLGWVLHTHYKVA